MAETKEAGLIVEREFECFEEFSHAASVWNADFRQMTAEKFSSTIFQAWVGDILISNGKLGCHVEQHGTTPVGMRTFAVPTNKSPEMLWFGHTVGPGTLLSFPVHGEIDVYSRPGFDVSTISIPEELLLNLLEGNGHTASKKILTPVEQVFRVREELLNRLRYQLRVLVPGLVKSQKRYRHTAAEIRENILSTLIQILFESSTGVNHVRHHTVAVLEQVIEYIHDHPHAESPLLISDLCDVSSVSERTLENLFKQNLDMTPKTFLTGHRLHGAHRELLRSHPSDTRIIDVATNWGFWHMGHFSAAYRKTYGELPSATLKRHF